jgi:hypothetical protein
MRWGPTLTVSSFNVIFVQKTLESGKVHVHLPKSRTIIVCVHTVEWDWRQKTKRNLDSFHSLILTHCLFVSSVRVCPYPFWSKIKTFLCPSLSFGESEMNKQRVVLLLSTHHTMHTVKLKKRQHSRK